VRADVTSLLMMVLRNETCVKWFRQKHDQFNSLGLGSRTRKFGENLGPARAAPVAARQDAPARGCSAAHRATGRQMLMLRYFEGRTYREIGTLLGAGEDAAQAQ